MKSGLILTISFIFFFSGNVFSKEHFLTLSDEIIDSPSKYYYVGMSGGKGANYEQNGALIGAIAGASIGINGNHFSGGIVGLVAGVLLGSLFDAASARPIEVKLNFTIGTFDSYLAEVQKKVESTLLFYASGFNNTESGIKLSFNGEYCCTLTPDKWTKVTLPSDLNTINASFITSNKDETQIEIIPTLFKTEYYFCLEKKKKPVKVTKADFEKREFLNRSISVKNKVELTCFN